MKSLTKKQLEAVQEKILEELYPLPIQKTQAEHAAQSIVNFLSRFKRPKKGTKKGRKKGKQ